VNWFQIHTLALISVTELQALNYFKKTTLVELVNLHPLLVTAVDREKEEEEDAIC
jgi:hypothetical protein